MSSYQFFELPFAKVVNFCETANKKIHLRTGVIQLIRFSYVSTSVRQRYKIFFKQINSLPHRWVFFARLRFCSRSRFLCSAAAKHCALKIAIAFRGSLSPVSWQITISNICFMVGILFTFYVFPMLRAIAALLPHYKTAPPLPLLKIRAVP